MKNNFYKTKKFINPMDLETGKFDSKSEEDKIIYLAELSNSLVERLRFVEITEKPFCLEKRLC